MMRTGRVPGLPGETPATGAERSVMEDLDLSRLASLENAQALFFASEWRGFFTYLIALPLDRPMADRFRLEMRLSGLTWRVVGLELPVAVRDRIVQQIIARGGT